MQTAALVEVLAEKIVALIEKSHCFRGWTIRLSLVRWRGYTRKERLAKTKIGSSSSLRVLCNDQPPNQYDNDGNVVSNVGCRAWTNADGDREHADQRAEKRGSLAGQSRRTYRRRPDPS